MHRAEARMRLIKRVGPLVLAVVVLGPGAFFIARALKSDDTVVTDRTQPSARLGPDPSAVPSASPSAIASNNVRTQADGGNVTTPVNVSPTHPAGGNGSSTTTKSARRNVTIASLRPPFGVHMTVDGAPSAEPSQGMSFTVDEKPHVLAFTCEKDMCEPRQVKIDAGDKDPEPLNVELRILSARVTVDGDPNHSYGIEEMPQFTLGSGVITEIPMTSGTKNVTIFDRNDSTNTLRKKVTLRAGQQESVSFR